MRSGIFRPRQLAIFLFFLLSLSLLLIRLFYLQAVCHKFYYKLADEQHTVSLELDPNNLALSNELGITYIYVGRFKEAIALFKKALEIKPDFALIHNNLALAYYYEKKYALAIRHCDKAIGLGYVVATQFLEMLKPYRK